MTDITLYYLTWLEREIGRGSEKVTLPQSIETVDSLLDYLASRGARYEVFAKKHVIFANVAGQIVAHDQRITDIEEIHFFSPIVGG